MPKVVFRQKLISGGVERRPSDALECDHCKTITWVWADADWASCRRCSLRFYNRAGKWVLRGELKSKKKAADPEG